MNLEDLFSLKGRVALVTGGSRGIGRMIVEGFLAAGIERVYISARKINEIEETCAELGDKVIGIQGDLSTIEGIEALVEELSGRESQLDILVNNAGAAWGVDYLEFPEAVARGGEPVSVGDEHGHALSRRVRERAEFGGGSIGRIDAQLLSELPRRRIPRVLGVRVEHALERYPGA